MSQLYLSLQLITEYGYVRRTTTFHVQSPPFISEAANELSWQKSIKFGTHFSSGGVETRVKFQIGRPHYLITYLSVTW